MAAAVPFITAAATAVQVIGSIQQGNAAKDAANYNAQVNRQNAVSARHDAALAAQQQDRVNRQRLGSIEAANAASGLTPGGSVFDVLGDAAAQGELQKQSILYRGEQRARGYANTATLDVMQGKNAQTAGYMQAGTDLLKGGVETYKAYKRIS